MRTRESVDCGRRLTEQDVVDDTNSHRRRDTVVREHIYENRSATTRSSPGPEKEPQRTSHHGDLVMQRRVRPQELVNLTGDRTTAEPLDERVEDKLIAS